MAHLKKSASSGRLLKSAAAHLIIQCLHPGSTTTPSGGPQNGCNACDPPMPDHICVDIAGIQGRNCLCIGVGGTTTEAEYPVGDMSVLNGAHVLEWEHDCTWAKRWVGPNGERYSIILWDSRQGGDFHHWVIWIQCICPVWLGGWRNCRFIFTIPPWPDPECDPTGDYLTWECSHEYNPWCVGEGCVCTETTDPSCTVLWCSGTSTTPAA